MKRRWQDHLGYPRRLCYLRLFIEELQQKSVHVWWSELLINVFNNDRLGVLEESLNRLLYVLVSLEFLFEVFFFTFLYSKRNLSDHLDRLGQADVFMSKLNLPDIAPGWGSNPSTFPQ
jgi:hypothetical protein